MAALVVSGGLGQAKLDSFAQEMAAGRITLGEWQSMRQVWVARSEQLRRAIGEQVDHRFIGWLTGQPIEQV